MSGHQSALSSDGGQRSDYRPTPEKDGKVTPQKKRQAYSTRTSSSSSSEHSLDSAGKLEASMARKVDSACDDLHRLGVELLNNSNQENQPPSGQYYRATASAMLPKRPKKMAVLQDPTTLEEVDLSAFAAARENKSSLGRLHFMSPPCLTRYLSMSDDLVARPAIKAQEYITTYTREELLEMNNQVPSKQRPAQLPDLDICLKTARLELFGEPRASGNMIPSVSTERHVGTDCPSRGRSLGRLDSAPSSTMSAMEQFVDVSGSFFTDEWLNAAWNAK